MKYVSMSEKQIRIKIANIMLELDKFLSVLNENDGILIADIKGEIISKVARIGDISKKLKDNNMKLIFLGDNDLKTDLINLFIDDFGFDFNKIIRKNVIVKGTLSESEKSNNSSKEIERTLSKSELKFQESINNGKSFEDLIDSIEIQQDICLNEIEMKFDFQNDDNNLKDTDISKTFIYIIDLFHITESQLENEINNAKSIIDKGYLLKIFAFGSQCYFNLYSKIINENIDSVYINCFTYREFEEKQFINIFADLKEECRDRRNRKLSDEFNCILDNLYEYIMLHNEIFVKVSSNYLSLNSDFEKISDSVVANYLHAEIKPIDQMYENIIFNEVNEFKYKAKLQYSYDDFKYYIEKIKTTFIENLLGNKVEDVSKVIISRLVEKYEEIAKKNCVSIIRKSFVLSDIDYDKFGKKTKFEFTFFTFSEKDFLFSKSIESIKGIIYLNKNRNQIIRKINVEAKDKYVEAYNLFFEYLYESILEDILKYKSSIERDIRETVEQFYIKSYGKLLGIFNLQESFKSVLISIEENKLDMDVNRNEFKA